jgi:hypothetical protein
VQREAQRLAAIARDRDFDDVRRLTERLGNRWHTPSRDALIALLTSMAEPTGSRER